MKALRLAVFACLACILAGPGDGQSDARAQGLTTAPYSQPPEMLPRRFRNHCSFDVTLGTFYCSNRCGSDYQFYYCSRRSFGCCHIGYGYCDYAGLLRCAP